MKKIQIVFLLCIGFFISNISYAQELPPKREKKLIKKGRKTFRKGKFYQSKIYYDKVTEAGTTNSQYWLEAGLVYFDSQVEAEKALSKFERALELSVNDTTPEILLYLGHAHHFIEEFEKAIEYYNLFKIDIKQTKKGEEIEIVVNRQIEICNNGIDLRLQKPLRYSYVENLGVNVNSNAADYAPVITNDENLILFCSRRSHGKKSSIDGQYFEDIFYTSKSKDAWKQATVIDKTSGYLNDEKDHGKRHEAPISLSPDGNTLYIYKDNSVWESKRDSRGQWSIPRRMNQNVNIGSFNPSIFITPNAKEMFIISEGAEGGLGGRDIYHTKIAEDGTWPEPKNLGPTINTAADEDAPFMSQDGKTLYFASNGHKTIGGYDIFKSVRDEEGNWTEPVNIGTPINSAGDDIYYVENTLGTIAYYASQRPGSFGFLDLYSARFDCANLPATNIKGYAIYSYNNQPVNGIIKITNKTTGEEMGTFNIDPTKGTYNMVLPPDETYTLDLVVVQSKYNQDRPHSEEFYIPKQCEAYNLFQQISINYLQDSTGEKYAQKAHFRNAMFDIESEVKNNTSHSTDINNTYGDSTTFIKGKLVFNSTTKAQFITVTLLNEKNEILRITETDDNGEFAFEQIDITKNYILMVNEDDAKRNYYGDNSENSDAEISINGALFTAKDKYKFASTNTTVYFANTNKIISNKTSTNTGGKFNLSNIPEDKEAIKVFNDNTVISYNMNIPTEEVLFSAYIVNLNPNNTELSYTEHIDIIELKDIDPTDTNGVNGSNEFANIYFDFDKFFLRTKSKNILDNLYDYLSANPNATVRLDGHTDWFGTDPYNLDLSENRTLKAYKYLIVKGISPERLINEWFGESKPAVANTNPDGSDNTVNRQLNRRVEIKLQIPEMAALYIQL